MIQLALAAFGLCALWLATSHHPRARRWAPLVGLCGQPFWLWFAWHTTPRGWGLLTLSLAYTAVYIRAAWLQWRLTRAEAEEVEWELSQYRRGK